MKPQGFAKVKSPRKSLQQEIKQVFRKIRLSERNYGSSTIAEIKAASQYAPHDSGNTAQGEIPTPRNKQIQESQKTDSGEDASKRDEPTRGNTVYGETPPCGESTGDWVCFEGRIAPEHWQELVEGSAIAPDIAALNFVSLGGNTPYEYLLYSDGLSRRNDGRLRDGDMRRYAHLSNGGWWCGGGVDILTGEDSLWGCFKPNSPRMDEGKGKPIKYEHPPKVDTEIFALRVPARIWKLISLRYDVALPEGYENLPHSAFWAWVKANTQIPVIICEGAKKAAAILSCGYVAIALPGISNGYRQPKNEFGDYCGAPYLIPQLGALAQNGRRVYFCFDADTKRTTVRNVNHAISKTAKLLTLRGCEVKVLSWLPVLGKGIDDAVAACGRDKFDEIYCNALTIEEWSTKQLKRLTYTPDLSVNQRYLGEVSIPSGKQLIALKSPKGTGKTHFFQWITDPVIRSGEKKVLVVPHRVQLGLQLCERLGLPFVTEVGQTDQGSHFGLGLCIDSLHPKSQAKFDPEQWRGCWIILDEVMQLIWHLISSNTCSKERVSIIKTLKQLLLNAVNYGGKIFIADADLNDIAIDFIKGLIGQEIDTFIVENTFKFVEPWQVNLVKGKNPSQLVNILTRKLGEGKKCFVCLSAQKASSAWGSYDLEKLYQKKYPNLRILRIDSTTVENPNHPAFGCTANLNEVVKDYDLILSTATIETGVSIETEHFDYVFGIFQGVQTTDSVRQHLSRYRPPVPRYIWLNGVGINKVGNGSSSVKVLLAGEYKKNKANIKKLLDLGFEENLEGGFESICINTWAKLAAIINNGMSKYSKQIISDLEDEGHIICDFEEIDPVEVEITKQEIYSNRDKEYLRYRENVAASESITDEQFLKLDNQRCKTESEQLKHKKGEIERRYNIDVTPDLIEKDDKKWHSKIRLHYYLGEGREYLADRDKNVMANALKNGDGDYFLVDSNKNLLGKKIDAFDRLRFDELLAVKEVSNNHDLAVDIFTKARQHSYDLKLITGIDFSKVKTPIEACRKLLDSVGYKFPMLRKEGKRGQQTRIYGTPAPDFKKDDEGKLLLVNGAAVPIPDQRGEVFKSWIERDRLAREKAAAAKLEAETEAAPMEADTEAAPMEALPTLEEQYTLKMSSVISHQMVVEEHPQESSANTYQPSEEVIDNSAIVQVDEAISRCEYGLDVSTLPVTTLWRRRLDRALMIGDEVARQIYQLLPQSLLNTVWDSLTLGTRNRYCDLFA